MGTFLSSLFTNVKDSIKGYETNELKEFPFGYNVAIKLYKEKFQFTSNDLIGIHNCFRKMDIQGTGYINLDNLYTFIDEELSSIISPYIERFFMLIEKENPDKVTFLEW